MPVHFDDLDQLVMTDFEDNTTDYTITFSDNKEENKRDLPKNYANVWKIKSYNPWYRIDKHIKTFFKNIKWSIQRIKYGYCDYDRWDIMYWFSDIMPRMLTEFANETNTYPNFIDDEDNTTFTVSHPINLSGEEDKEDADYIRWRNILYNIADKLTDYEGDFTKFEHSEYYNNDTDNYEQYDKYEFDDVLKDDLKELNDYINHEGKYAVPPEYDIAHKSYFDHYNKYNEDVRNNFIEGLKLFTKYYYDMWD